MRIKSYKTRRFAGLKDLEVSFKPGLNVILGANESGKSSLIEGIHSSLFKDVSLNMSTRRDKDFVHKFMPLYSGDYIDGSLTLETDKGNYELFKAWGQKEELELVKPDGSLIKSEKEIKKVLEELLEFSEASYSSIVFAKQRDLKKTLGNIMEDREVSKDITDLLRRSLMELDGVSINKMEEDLEEEIESIFKRWDRDKAYPENNRGINNPYKNGLGRLVKAYYAKEGLKMKMEEANKAEKHYGDLAKSLKEVRDEREKLEDEKTRLEAIEADINQRELLEVRIRALEEKEESFKGLSKDWPVLEEKLKQSRARKEELEERKLRLKEEEDRLESFSRKRKLETKLKEVEEVEESLRLEEEGLARLSPVKEEELRKLEDLRSQKFNLEARMMAGDMEGRITYLKEGPVTVSQDFKEALRLEESDSFKAKGILEINYRDELKLEIKSSDLDLEELKKNYDSLDEEYKKILEDLGLQDLEEVRKEYDSLRNKENKIGNLKKELELKLGDTSLEDLRDEISSLGDLGFSRTKEEIEEDLRKLAQEEIGLLSDIKTMENKLAEWEESYGDSDQLFDQVIDIKSKLRLEVQSLDGLSPLPEDFEKVEDFKERLDYLRTRTRDLGQDLRELEKDYYEAKAQLADETFEELSRTYEERERDFKRELKRGENLLKVRAAFLETKEKMLKDPMEPLVKDFTELIEGMSSGSYFIDHIDEDLKIRLKNKDGEMPIDYLSAGTYDLISLALRFALLKHIFRGSHGFLILDDCLVDLDPKRKEEAVKLIREFSEDYQIIFTTCDPETAKILSGNLIKMEEIKNIK